MTISGNIDTPIKQLAGAKSCMLRYVLLRSLGTKDKKTPFKKLFNI
jgi:hypothetical protein